MGQVTIYLEDELEVRMLAAVRATELSKSKWIASLIREKLVHKWPDSVRHLEGSWRSSPDLKDLRGKQVPDVPREPL